MIEVMITVVIVAILASIAYPSYTRWVAETRRTDAQIALQQTAALLEKYFTQCSRYTTNFTAARNCAAAGLGLANNFSPDRHYTLVIAGDPDTTNDIATSYRITASPTGAQATIDSAKCTTIFLSSTGAKSATGSEAAKCWKN